MEKPLRAILLAFQPQAIQLFFSQIDLRRVHLLAVFSDQGESIRITTPPDKTIPTKSFSDILPFIHRYREENVYWILTTAGAYDNLGTVARLLAARGIRRDHILNGHVGDATHFQGNLRYAEREDLDYIATGISYMEFGLDITQIPYRGVNLAVSSQDLYYGYRIAEDIFSHGRHLRFCLIGITPYSLGYQMHRSFMTEGVSRQYELLLPGEVREDDLFFQLLSDAYKAQYVRRSFPADPNYDRFKTMVPHNISLKDFFHVEKMLQDVVVKLRQDAFASNLETMKAYIRLCNEHHAKPIAVVLPLSPIIHDRYPGKELADFRAVMTSLQDEMGLSIIDLFDLRVDYDGFYDLVHMNPHGAALASRAVAERLELILHGHS